MFGDRRLKNKIEWLENRVYYLKEALARQHQDHYELMEYLKLESVTIPEQRIVRKAKKC